MALLFAGGVMNLLWVAVLAAVVLIEKLFRSASGWPGSAVCCWRPMASGCWP